MSGLRISEDLREKKQYLITPILWHFTFLDKTSIKVVFPYDRPKTITERIHTYPIFLPGLGRLIALDITTESLNQEFYNMTVDYAGFDSQTTAITSKLYQFDSQNSRAVSWGELDQHDLSEEIAGVYHFNLLNELFATPSILVNDSLDAPTRWYTVSSESVGGPRFNATINYNVGIVDIQHDGTLEKETIWLNGELEIYRVTGEYIFLKPTGEISQRSLDLFIPEGVSFDFWWC